MQREVIHKTIFKEKLSAMRVVRTPTKLLLKTSPKYVLGNFRELIVYLFWKKTPGKMFLCIFRRENSTDKSFCGRSEFLSEQKMHCAGVKHAAEMTGLICMPIWNRVGRAAADSGVAPANVSRNPATDPSTDASPCPHAPRRPHRAPLHIRESRWQYSKSQPDFFRFIFQSENSWRCRYFHIHLKN